MEKRYDKISGRDVQLSGASIDKPSEFPVSLIYLFVYP